jgi:hypothetical protein
MVPHQRFPKPKVGSSTLPGATIVFNHLKAKCGRVIEPAEIRRVSSDENGMPQPANHVSGLGEKQTGDERNVTPQSTGVALVDEIRRDQTLR